MFQTKGKKRAWLIGEISKICEERKISKAQIARELHILPQQLNNIINGSRGVTDDFLDNFIRTFNLNQLDLYSQLLPDPNACSIYKRIIDIFNEMNISVSEFQKNYHINKNIFENALHWDDPKTANGWANIVVNTYPKYSLNWILTGEGSRYSDTQAKNTNVTDDSKKKIPLYADVASIGGCNNLNADVSSQSGNAIEWIDAGDWFPGATAAIHHYGDSMIEYPSGCILALKRVEDMRLIINGKNYVIETDEFRITKQLQYDGGDYIMAYSSNRDTYPDGRLIHAPIKIPIEAVRHIDLVIGSVIKEFSNGAIPIRKK